MIRSKQEGEGLQTMTKRSLANILAREVGMKKSLAYQCADALFEGLAESVVRGDRIEIRGFGSWEVKEARAKNGRNPKTSERVFVPARKKVMFRAGRILRADLSCPLPEQ